MKTWKIEIEFTDFEAEIVQYYLERVEQKAGIEASRMAANLILEGIENRLPPVETNVTIKGYRAEVLRKEADRRDVPVDELVNDLIQIAAWHFSDTGSAEDKEIADIALKKAVRAAERRQKSVRR